MDMLNNEQELTSSVNNDISGNNDSDKIDEQDSSSFLFPPGEASRFEYFHMGKCL